MSERTETFLVTTPQRSVHLCAEHTSKAKLASLNNGHSISIALLPPTQQAPCFDCALPKTPEEDYIDENVETFVTQYNDVYCDQRKAGIGGGDAERAAMRQVLILAIGALRYRGNSVSYVFDKMQSYQAAIDRAWDAMRWAGHGPDGSTELSEAISKTLKAYRKENRELRELVAKVNADIGAIGFRIDSALGKKA